MAFMTYYRRVIASVFVIAMAAGAFRATAQAAESHYTTPANAFHIGARARGPLHELWVNSLSAKQERVACLGGRIDHDVVYITRVELLAPSRADSADISAITSLRECSAPVQYGPAKGGNIGS